MNNTVLNNSLKNVLFFWLIIVYDDRRTTDTIIELITYKASPAKQTK